MYAHGGEVIHVYTRSIISIQLVEDCNRRHMPTVSMKKALRETQTLRAGCSKAEPKKLRPAADPFPGTRDGQNLISWRCSLPLPTDPVW